MGGIQVKTPDVVVASYFFMISRAQLVVDAATWLGAHNKAMAEFKGDTEKAGRFADRMVTRSQASGIFADRTMLERGTLNANVRQTELVRMWTALISYFIAKSNVAYERTRKTNFRNPGQVMSWAADMALLYTVEAILVGLLRGEFPDDDDDESVAGFIAGETVNSILAGVPLVREFASEVKGFRGAGTFGAVRVAVGKTAKQLSQGEVDAALVKSANRLGGIFFKYPASQINKTGEAIDQALDGEETSALVYLMGPER